MITLDWPVPIPEQSLTQSRHPTNPEIRESFENETFHDGTKGDIITMRSLVWIHPLGGFPWWAPDHLIVHY